MSVTPDKRVVNILILAAGGGARMGGGKLLLPWRGKPILLHVVDAAVACQPDAPPYLVIGHDADRVRAAVGSDRDIRFVENADWRLGQSTSLRLGIAAIAASRGAERLSGVMVMLGDQPEVKPETLALLARAHTDAVARDAGHPATVPVLDGRRGNPVILSPVLFPRVMTLEGDTGARAILSELGDAVLKVSTDDPGIFRDIDTPDEYARLKERHNG